MFNFFYLKNNKVWEKRLVNRSSKTYSKNIVENIMTYFVFTIYYYSVLTIEPLQEKLKRLWDDGVLVFFA